MLDERFLEGQLNMCDEDVVLMAVYVWAKSRLNAFAPFFPNQRMQYDLTFAIYLLLDPYYGGLDMAENDVLLHSPGKDIKENVRLPD